MIYRLVRELKVRRAKNAKVKTAAKLTKEKPRFTALTFRVDEIHREDKAWWI